MNKAVKLTIIFILIALCLPVNCSFAEETDKHRAKTSEAIRNNAGDTGRLPVIYIDNVVEGKDAIGNNEYFNGTVRICGTEDFPEDYSGSIMIKKRGRGSAIYDKKPYKIKFPDKVDLFGFGRSRHYVLLANYLDPGLIRNTNAFTLSRVLGLVAPDSIWVELVLNGEYLGNYLLCEHVRFGDNFINPTKEYDSGILSCGNVLLCFDTSAHKYDYYFATNKGIKVAVADSDSDVTAEDFANIKEFVNCVEEALYADNGCDRYGRHYSELVDMDSAAAFWLVSELLGNDDGAVRSRFCYFSPGGKLTFGPVWDFDIGGGAYRSIYPEKGFTVTNTLLADVERQDIWTHFCGKKDFRQLVLDKYKGVREYLLDMVREGGIIDIYTDYIYESAVENERLWTGRDCFMRRSFTGRYGDYEIYKSFLITRFNWFDEILSSDESFKKALDFPVISRLFIFNDSFSEDLKLLADGRTVDYYGKYNLEGAYGAEKILCPRQCSHSFIKVPERDASDEIYGIRECLYCPLCGHYFSESENHAMLYAKDVVYSVKSSPKPYGLRYLIDKAFLSLLILASILPVPIKACVRSRRKKKSSGKSGL